MWVDAQAIEGRAAAGTCGASGTGAGGAGGAAAGGAGEGGAGTGGMSSMGGIGGSSAGGSSGAGGSGGCGGSTATCDLPTTFKWTSSAALVSPKSNASHALVSVKDPTIVFAATEQNPFAGTANVTYSQLPYRLGLLTFDR